MKEEELGQLVEQLLQAEQAIMALVAGKPVAEAAAAAAATVAADANSSLHSDAAVGAAGAWQQQQLELVGRAVALDPLAAAAAAVAALELGGGGSGEVLAVPAGREASQLIPAFRPGGRQADEAASAASAGGCWSECTSDAEDEGATAAGLLGADADARRELRASVDAGALSLLLTPSGGQVQRQQLSALLARVPAATPDGRLGVDAVARCLGLHQPGSVAALLRFVTEASSGGKAQGDAVACSGCAADLAETIRPRGGAGQDVDSASLPTAAPDDAAPPAGTANFSSEEVERGLCTLLHQLVLRQPSTADGSAGATVLAPPAAVAASGAQLSAAVPPQPTSRQYWQAQADGLLSTTMLRSWELLEQQASQQLAMLQGRTEGAEEVRGGGGGGGRVQRSGVPVTARTDCSPVL